jgi:hypothetical protein
MAGTLTPLQLDAGDGLLQNQGIGVNANLTQAIASYTSTALIAPFLDTIAVGNTFLTNTVIVDLQTLAASTCPALSNSIPPTYANIGVGNPFISIGIANANIKQMTTVVTNQANVDICGPNVSKLAQAVNQAEGYASQATTFINSAVNSQTYLGNTFTNMDNMITGSVTAVNTDPVLFGEDLRRLGRLIDLANLDNFGSPLALMRQLYAVSAVIPTLSVAFVEAGINADVVLNINNPTVSVVDSDQQLMYRVMTQVTGTDLAQILSVLAVTTVGIETMADLLNPLKLFPLSYQTLTVPTANGSTPVYINASGSVNTNLTTLLPPYVVSSLV